MVSTGTRDGILERVRLTIPRVPSRGLGGGFPSLLSKGVMQMAVDETRPVAVHLQSSPVKKESHAHRGPFAVPLYRWGRLRRITEQKVNLEEPDLKQKV